MAIDAGDAVLTFLGDTTQLDIAMQKVSAEVPASMGAAGQSVDVLNEKFVVGQNGAVKLGEVANLAGEEVRASMYEARGELGLLGEEFGVKLPRHVRSFVAELPGVGEALTAAFSATAVLFLVQALFEVTEKVVKFIDETFIMTESMKNSNEQIAETNKTLEGQAKEVAKLNLEYELLGLKGLAKTRKELELLNETLSEGKRKFEDIQKELDHLNQHQDEFIAKFKESQGVFSEAGDVLKAFFGAQTSDTVAYYKKQGELEGELQVARGQNEITKDQIRNKDKVAAEERAEALDKYNKLLKKAFEEQAASIEKLNKEQEKQADDVSKIETARLEASIKAEEKATALKLKLYKETLAAYSEELNEEEHELEGSTARKARELARELQLGVISHKQYGQEVKKLYDDEVKALVDVINRKEALLNHADAGDLVKLRKFENDKIKITEQAAARVEQATIKQNQLIAQTSNAAAQAVTSSVAAVVTGSETMVQALGKITQAILDSIAQEATVQGGKQLALAAGAAGSYDFASMAHHLESAGLWFALGGGLAAAGGLAGGAGGGGSSPNYSNQNYGSAASLTGSSFGGGPAGGTGVHVQKFATGGLVTAPTLAIVGDSASGGSANEAILPLDDDRVMNKLAAKIGGGTHIHVNVKGGVISSDTLTSVIGQISKKVKAGQAHLESSNSGRVTRRS
ncbi:MAG TPA: hypothetical protein VNY29_12160 [Terriglobales bacterium]|jgi:hypothetical protein|nr:hypothetical protein [Terriglobales bacterium]